MALTTTDNTMANTAEHGASRPGDRLPVRADDDTAPGRSGTGNPETRTGT